MAELIPMAADGTVDRVAAVLQGGGTVILPTDTVYGVAALPGIPAAVERIFELKGRPAGMHLPVLVGLDQLPLVSRDSRPGVQRLVGAFWPGSLTIVLPSATELVSNLGDNDGTVGARCPDHDLIRDVTSRVGPLATTSANRHGAPTPTTAAGAAGQLPGVDLVVDGGECEGSASTVVDLSGLEPVILRAGAISAEAIEAAWALHGGQPVQPGTCE